MKKALKILILSSKGGVGKSTIAMQIVAPYLYLYNNKQAIKYYEFDDENKDYLSFGQSHLSIRKNIKVSENYFNDEMTEIFCKNESVCVDIGGNKTTSIALNALNDSGMAQLIDLVIIPLLDGEQDGISAGIVYQKLKALNPDLKILFILNKVKSMKKVKYQFENYFGDPRGIFSEKYALKAIVKKEELKHYAMMLDNDVVKYSRRFGLTIYEIAKQERDFISDIKKNMKNYSSENEIKLVSFKNYINNHTKIYYDKVIIPIFKRINVILNNKELL